MGGRGKQAWSRDELPLGTVRIRKSKGVRKRVVKIGPRQWTTYARWWWLENRGPIPDGMRVVHADGNPLNDDPANYLLANAGDVLYLARQWDEQLDDRNRRAAGAAAAKHNRDRARVRRALGYLPTRWYLVDVERRVVVNDPRRSRVALYAAWSGVAAEDNNGCGLNSRWLGWADVRLGAACLLAALADGEVCFSTELRRRMTELRRLHDWRPHALPDNGFATSSTIAKQRGLLVVERVPGELLRRYRITAQAQALREPPCPFVACRGSDLERRFGDCDRVWPAQYAAGKMPRKQRNPGHGDPSCHP